MSSVAGSTTPRSVGGASSSFGDFMGRSSRRERNEEAAAAAAAAAELEEALRAARTALKLDMDMTVNLTDKPIGDDGVGDLSKFIGKCQKLTKIM